MEQARETKLNGLKAVVYILITIFLATTVNAQENFLEKLPNKERAIQNLVLGIESDNSGLKRSSIYFAGKYRVTEAVNELIEVLNKEKDTEIRKVTALVLYKIGDQKGLNAVKKLAETDEDNRVRNLCAAITVAYNDNITTEWIFRWQFFTFIYS